MRFGHIYIAVAAVLALSALPIQATATDHHKAQWITNPIQVDQFTASTPQQAAESRSKTIASHYGLSHQTALQIAEASPQRQSVVFAALSYLGTPYVLDGASHSAIDCSGLTMLAYDAVGIHMVHYVPTQDEHARVHLAPGHEAVGDLLVFNDGEHIAIYMGNGLLIQAPEPGKSVEIVPLSDWDGAPWHVARYLP